MFSTPDSTRRLRAVALALPFAFAAVIFLFSVAGYSWMDEVAYADPAARFATGSGFTSASWWQQPDDAFWAGNTPLPELVLAAPYRLFGVSTTTGRVFWLALYAASVSMVLHCLISTGALRTVRFAVFASAALMFSPAGWQASGIGRPDALGIFLCSLAFVTACRNPASPWLGVIAAGLVWSGPQLWVFAPLAAMLSLPVIPAGRRIRFLVTLAAGAVAGGLSLGILYLATRSHLAFLHSTFLSSHNSAGQIMKNSGHISTALLDKILQVVTAPASDLWTFCLGLIPLVWMLAARVSGRPLKLQASAFLWSLLIPMGMSAAGKYPPYYHWMALFPTVIAAVSAWQARRSEQKSFAGRLLPWGAAGATAVFSILAYGLLPPAERTDRTLTSLLPVSEPVLADFFVYFEVFGRHPSVFTPFYGGGSLFPKISSDPSDRVRWAVLCPKNSACLTRWGGNWKERGRARVFLPSVFYAITGGAAGQFNSVDRELVLLEKSAAN